MNLKISRGEEARKLLVRYAWTLNELKEAEEACKKFDSENPFEGGGAYADAGWCNNTTRRELWSAVSTRRKMIEDFEREIKALAGALLEDARAAAPEAEGNLIKYPWEIEQATIESTLSVLETIEKGQTRAVQLKFENPLVIDNLTRKLFNQERTSKGRVFAYAVVKPEFDQSGDPIPQREAILALLPISPAAQSEALLFALSHNLVSLFLQAYLEARREIDNRDQLSVKLNKP